MVRQWMGWLWFCWLAWCIVIQACNYTQAMKHMGSNAPWSGPWCPYKSFPLILRFSNGIALCKMIMALPFSTWNSIQNHTWWYWKVSEELQLMYSCMCPYRGCMMSWWCNKKMEWESFRATWWQQTYRKYMYLVNPLCLWSCSEPHG